MELAGERSAALMQVKGGTERKTSQMPTKKQRSGQRPPDFKQPLFKTGVRACVSTLTNMKMFQVFLALALFHAMSPFPRRHCKTDGHRPASH